MEITQRVWIILSLRFLTAERYLIVKAAKLNQCVCFKYILTLNIMSKDILLWKGSSAFVSTEDENQAYMV